MFIKVTLLYPYGAARPAARRRRHTFGSCVSYNIKNEFESESVWRPSMIDEVRSR